MNMKKLILPALIGSSVLLGAAPLPAAQKAETFAEVQAKKLATDDGYIIFAYADGWDQFSKKRCEKLMADKAILKAAGNAVIMPFPVPEYTNDETKKKMAERYGELKVPDANSYPAIILLNAKGQHYATIYGRPVSRGKAEDLAGILTDRMEKGRKRASLLAEAEAAKSPGDKAQKTYAAYQIDGLSGFGKGFSGHLKKLDPKDEGKTQAAANYDHFRFVGEIGKKDIAAAVKQVEEMIESPLYTDRQKQLMCAAILGELRRKAGPAGAEDIRHFARKMKVLGPETAEGHAADLILRDWVVTLRLDEGWTPSTLPVNKEPIEVEGDIPITTPGTYTVRFDWKSGAQGLNILGVELRDGKLAVAKDYHKGSTGYKNNANIYTLKVDKAVKDPHLFISVDMKNRDSRGQISILKL